MDDDYSSTDGSWSSDSETDCDCSECSPHYTRRGRSSRRGESERNSNGRNQRRPRSRTHSDRDRRRSNAGNTKSKTLVGSHLAKAAAVVVGRAIFKLVKHKLDQRRGSPQKPSSSRTVREHGRTFYETRSTRDNTENIPTTKTNPIPPIIALQNTSSSLHRSLSSLNTKADTLHHSILDLPIPDLPPLDVKREGAELLAHCNSLRNRVECFVEDVEAPLAKDHDGRRKGSVSKGLRGLWKDAEELRREVDAFVKAQRDRLGRVVFY